MNAFVTKIFSLLLAGLHATVILILLYLLWQLFTNPDLSFLNRNDPDFMEDSILVAVGAFLVYVIIIGFITVIVSINENLVESKKLLEKIVQQNDDILDGLKTPAYRPQENQFNDVIRRRSKY